MLGVLAANGETSPVDAFVASSIATLETVADSETDTDLALAASALTLPSENVLCEAVKAEGVAVDPTAVHVRFLTEILDDFRRFVDEIWRL